MRARFLLLFTAVAACGCSTTAVLERQFGHSVAELRSRQILDPQALERQRVAGYDGRAANAAYEAYHKSQAAPVPQAAAFTIGVGARQ